MWFSLLNDHVYIVFLMYTLFKTYTEFGVHNSDQTHIHLRLFCTLSHAFIFYRSIFMAV